jgi:hypothetical protein
MYFRRIRVIGHKFAAALAHLKAVVTLSLVVDASYDIRRQQFGHGFTATGE